MFQQIFDRVSDNRRRRFENHVCTCSRFQFKWSLCWIFFSARRLGPQKTQQTTWHTTIAAAFTITPQCTLPVRRMETTWSSVVFGWFYGAVRQSESRGLSTTRLKHEILCFMYAAAGFTAKSFGCVAFFFSGGVHHEALCILCWLDVMK